MALEKALKSSLDSKEIKPVSPKGNQLWILIGRTDAEARVPVLWPSDVKSWLIGKDPNPEKGLGEEKRLRGLDSVTNSVGTSLSERLGDSEGQGSLVCCSLWVYRVGHGLVTEQHLEEYASESKSYLSPGLYAKKHRDWKFYSHKFIVLEMLFSRLVISNSFVTPWTIYSLPGPSVHGKNTGVGFHFIL